MSAAVDMSAVEVDAEKLQAERAATMAADEAFETNAEAEFEERLQEYRDVAFLKRPGVDLAEPLRLLGEAGKKLKRQKQRVLNLRDRWAREDAGEVKQTQGRLRETKPASAIRWGMLATPLLKAMGVNSEFGRDDPRLLDHDLLYELAIGEDMTPAEQQAEAFDRLVRCVGSYAATDLKLAAAETINGVVMRLVLAGQCLPPIAMPEGEEAQRLHLRLGVLEHQALDEFRGWGPVPTRDEQEIARFTAWRWLLDEERQALPQGMSVHQRQRKLIELLPEWAASVGAA